MELETKIETNHERKSIQIIMSNQHVIQVRDLVAMLALQPQDAEVDILIGETTEFITEVKYGLNDSRRRVSIHATGEDRINELEGKLHESDAETLDYESFIEMFDKTMQRYSFDKMSAEQLAHEMKRLHDEEMPVV